MWAPPGQSGLNLPGGESTYLLYLNLPVAINILSSSHPLTLTFTLH